MVLCVVEWDVFELVGRELKGLEQDARELRAKYEAMLAAKKRKAATEGNEAKGNKRGKK